MSNEPVRFEPNTPVHLRLSDPEGEYNDDLRQGSWITTDGRILKLPRAATVLLYALEPRPDEEIQITKYLREHPKRFEWTVCLTPQSERIRAGEEIAASEAQNPSDLAPALEASIAQVESRKPASGPPVLLKRPPKKAANPDQPRLFDRGTGTDGPSPARQAVPAAATLLKRTKYPDMLLHITRTVKWALAEANLQLGDGPTQDLISTVYIDAAKRSGIEYDFTEESR